MIDFDFEARNTIVAVATPPGTGGIAVVRISGPEAIDICMKGWRGKNLRECGSHTAHLGSVCDAEGNVIDQCVAVVFRGPASFTGEDTVELSLHGSPWIQRTMVQTLIGYGAVPAGAGEFTRRAFLNGRLDLAQAEGVADLISASSRAAHRLALQQTGGGFSKRIGHIKDKLTEFAALLELELDFSEEDVEFADRTRLLSLARESRDAISGLASTFHSGKILKSGVPVVIAGLPNAGKSTLLNRLLREEKAIVTPIAGTTRDILEGTVEIGGILFRFIDTAGLHESTDEVERIGIEKARERISNARIVIWMTDPGEDEEKQKAELLHILPTINPAESTLIHFRNKTDLYTIDNNSRLAASYPEITGSAQTGEGIDLLESLLIEIATAEHNPDSELIVTNERHAIALTAAATALTRAIEGLTSGLPSDLIAMDIREAISHLSELTGALTTDHLLHHIFSRFCIGK